MKILLSEFLEQHHLSIRQAAAQMKEHLEAAKPKTKTYLGEYFPEDSGKAE